MSDVMFTFEPEQALELLRSEVEKNKALTESHREATARNRKLNEERDAADDKYRTAALLGQSESIALMTRVADQLERIAAALEARGGK